MGMPIEKLFEAIIKIAVDNNASDIHLSPTNKPQMRVNGQLQPIISYVLTTQDTNQLAGFIMSGEVRDEVVHGEIGDSDFAISYYDYRFRGNTAKTRNGLVIALRFLPRQIPTLTNLGLPEQTIAKLLTRNHGGIILVTGPTGSGKTTTMASIVDHLNQDPKRHQHIITIEAPVEYEHPHKNSQVDQRELPVDAPNFGSALRAALRQDPDIILVGEMRDLETIGTAIAAAETGHLVLSTLHTNSASETIHRIVDSFPSGQQMQIRMQISTSLIAVISQRLIPRINGQGRIAAYELMVNNMAIGAMIRDNKVAQIISAIQTGGRDGMVCFDDSLRNLVAKNVISGEVALTYAIDQKNF